MKNCLPLSIGERYFDYLASLPDPVLLMDESHRYRATAGMPRAMEDGFVKEQAVVTRKDCNPAGKSPVAIQTMKLAELKLATIPTLVLAGMTEAERRAYIIADNRLAACAGWDEDQLASELAAIASLDGELDLALTGFDGGALEKLLELAAAGPVGPDEVPEIDTSQPAVSRTGVVWIFGKHRLIVGDARDPAVFETLMAGEVAQMAITDPPYNVPVEGHVCGLGKVKHAEFAMASRKMSEAEFESFLATTLGNLARFSKDGSIHYVFMDWRHMNESLAAGGTAYTELQNLIVWNKDNGGMATSIAQNTSWYSCSRTALRNTSTTSVLARTAATGGTCGTTQGPARSVPIVTRSWRCIRRSSRWRCLQTRCATARGVTASCLMPSRAWEP